MASATTTFAQTSPSPEPQTPAAAKSDVEAEVSGWDFGGGIGVTIDFGGLERISEAEVVNGVVRVRDEDDAIIGLVGELHFFFPSSRSFLGVAKEDWGHGPFFAVQTGDQDFLATAALGWMIGFRRPNATESWNLGVGIAMNPNVKTLGDGIERNQPLPAGETQIRYREESQYGAIILFSRSF